MSGKEPIDKEKALYMLELHKDGIDTAIDLIQDNDFDNASSCLDDLSDVICELISALEKLDEAQREAATKEVL